MNEVQAKKIDTLLQSLIDLNSGTRYPIMFDDSIHIKTNLSFDEITDILETVKKMEFLGFPIAIFGVQEFPKYGKFQYVRANYNTEHFLAEMGSVKYFNEIAENKRKETERIELEGQKLRNDIASFRITKKQYIWNKIFAIAGFILGLISFLWQMLKNA